MPRQGARHVSASAANVYQQDELRGAKQRCQFTYSDGRRCGNERAPLCVHHGSQQREPRTQRASDAPVETPELAALCGDLTTATNINRALAQTFLLMAQGRISQKQAVAFGYIAQLLLQTVPGIRSEFVSAYGQFPWKEKLKASLERDDNWDDGDSPGRSGENIRQSGDGVVEPKKGVAITPFFRHEKVIPSVKPERGISPILVTAPASSGPLNEAHLSEQSSRAGVTPAGYPSLLQRGVDLMAGKYDVTPEREASRLKSAGSKPPKAHMSKVVTLVPTIRPGSSSRATNESEGPLVDESSPAETPSSPHGVILSESRIADERRISLQAGELEPTDPVDSPYMHAPDTFTSEGPTPVAPTGRERGHTTQWFAPAAWSGRSRPDPCPSRYERLKREFRSMSNSAFRRLHHQNSRGFWSPELKHVTT